MVALHPVPLAAAVLHLLFPDAVVHLPVRLAAMVPLLLLLEAGNLLPADLVPEVQVAAAVVVSPEVQLQEKAWGPEPAVCPPRREEEDGSTAELKADR